MNGAFRGGAATGCMIQATSPAGMAGAGDAGGGLPAYLISTLICFGFAFYVLGRLTSRTPSLSLALILSASMELGTEKERTKIP